VRGRRRPRESDTAAAEHGHNWRECTTPAIHGQGQAGSTSEPL